MRKSDFLCSFFKKCMIFKCFTSESAFLVPRKCVKAVMDSGANDSDLVDYSQRYLRISFLGFEDISKSVRTNRYPSFQKAQLMPSVANDSDLVDYSQRYLRISILGFEHISNLFD